MNSIHERNQIALQRMRERYKNILASDSNMTLGEVFEFGKSLIYMQKVLDVGDNELSQLMSQLLSVVDTQESKVGSKERYKLVNKYSWACDNFIRDWNNRGEMGK